MSLRMTPPPAPPGYASSTLIKGLRLFESIARDDGRSNLAAIAGELGIPAQTAHRLAMTLETEGFLMRMGKGVYRLGPRAAALSALRQETPAFAARLRRPLAKLARSFGALAHAGILEDGMVTYVVKEGGDAGTLFTAEKMQLEAYCSAIGKILLADLPGGELDAYLAGGPLVALTANTITDADRLRRELEEVRAGGVAHDRYEIRADLYCMAVALRNGDGRSEGAISLSFVGGAPDPDTERRAIRRLRAIARRHGGDGASV